MEGRTGRHPRSRVFRGRATTTLGVTCLVKAQDLEGRGSSPMWDGAEGWAAGTEGQSGGQWGEQSTL